MADAPGDVRVLTVTVSDHRKRFADEAGKKLDSELTAAGFKVVRHLMLADDEGFIRELVRSTATDNEADAIILTGGTGITPRDRTCEALEGMFEKRIDGFGEAFRRMAFDVMGPNAMFFRATAGVYNSCPIFALPGNVQAVMLGVQRLIAPTLARAVALAMGKQTQTVGPVGPASMAAPPSTSDLLSTPNLSGAPSSSRSSPSE